MVRGSRRLRRRLHRRRQPLHLAARTLDNAAARANDGLVSPTPRKRSASRPTRHEAAPRTTIAVRGARVHNLKNVSLEIPRDKLIVVTGLSGSGKSSLAFDTIYAEGQRRYM